MSEVVAYQCDREHCRKLMSEGEGFEFIGNVHVLEQGGIIGNNLELPASVDSSPSLVGSTVTRVLHYCPQCTYDIFEKAAGDMGVSWGPGETDSPVDWGERDGS